MQRAHKIRLVPTGKQEDALKRTCGASRYAYNWALEQWKLQYEAFKSGTVTTKPSAYALCSQWTVEKPDWARDIYSGAQARAILNVGKAMVNFWEKRASFPSFKKKNGKQSFDIAYDKAAIKGKTVRIPGVGWVKMREELRFQGKILGYNVSLQADQWHLSVQVEMPDLPKPESNSKVGVDVGIKSIAVASDGTICGNPKSLKAQERYLRRQQRKLARQKKGSKRREATKQRIVKAHLRASNVRQDAIHKFTSALSKNHGHAVVETLDVKEMSEKGQKHLRRLLQDTAMHEVHRQLEYKMGDISYAPRYFPSSKTCSSCGKVKDTLTCAVRVYKCDHCGLVLDRDLNAAVNLEKCPGSQGVRAGRGRGTRSTAKR